MKRYKLSKKAESDFRKIWNYTFDSWGEKQAEIYTTQLKSIFSTLASDPQKGKSIDQIKIGYFKYRIQKHTIYYRRANTGLEIVRILHEKMDVTRHL